MSTDPGGFYGRPAAPPEPEPWAVSVVPNPRSAVEPPPRAPVPAARKRTSYERTRVIVGAVLVLIVGAIVALSLILTNIGSKQAAKTATTRIQKAGAVVLKADLSNAATAEETALATNSSYSASIPQLRASGFIESAGDTVKIISASATHYCLSATSQLGGTLYLDSALGTPSINPCH